MKHVGGTRNRALGPACSLVALTGLYMTLSGCGAPPDSSVSGREPVGRQSGAVTSPPVAPSGPFDPYAFIKSLIGYGKDLSSAYSGIKTGYQAIVYVGTLLGIFDPTPDPIAALQAQIDALSKQVDARAADLDWKMVDLAYQNLQWAPVHSALDAARQSVLPGGVALVYNGTPDTNSEQGTEAASSPFNFQRLFVESVTDGPWKSIIVDNEPDKTSDITGDQVFDWRLAMPWLTQLISWRLFIMGAVDPNFATDGAYSVDLDFLRSALKDRLAQMVSGVRCEIHDRAWPGQDVLPSGSGGNGLPPPYSQTDIACADVNTGLSAVSTYVPVGCSAEFGCPYPCYTVDPSSPRGNSYLLDTTCANNWGPVAGIRDQLYRQVLSQMPVFEVQALIDTLYRYLHPGTLELTQLYGQISAESARTFCLEASPPPPTYPQATQGASAGEFGAAPSGLPVWIKPCSLSAEQYWTYDRSTGRISSANNQCLEVAPSRDVRTLSPSPVPNAYIDAVVAQDPVSTGAYVAVADCDVADPAPGNALPRAQQWSYDPETEVLTNGSALPGYVGTRPDVLDIQWDNVQSGTPVWVWDYNDGPAQQWHADQPLGFQPSPPAGCGVLTVNQGLRVGDRVTSCDGRFYWQLGADANLVLYQILPYDPWGFSRGTLTELVWSTGSEALLPDMLIMQGDGNLVLYSETGVPLWSTGTVGYPGSYLAIQNDGNLVVYDVTGQARWASNTCCR